MFFRNLTFFRFPSSLVWQTAPSPADPEKRTLDCLLFDCKLKPVGPSELTSRGWVPPFGRAGDAMFHQAGDALWITLGGEDRLLPGSVINDLLAKKVAEVEQAEGRKLNGRARKRLREDLVMELLPRALVKPMRLNAYLDVSRGFLAVDCSSRRAAESVVSELRHALGSFPAVPLNAEVSARAVLTGWLAGETLPLGLVLGDECVLQDPVDGGGVVRCTREELQTEQIQKHLEAGKQVSRLALVLDGHVSFTLGEDLVVRKLKFLDGAIDQLEDTEHDGLHAELDARFALMSGEVGRLFDVLGRALRFSVADDAPKPAAAGQPFDDERDPLYPEAVKVVVESGKASVSYVQRVLKLGYNRAARLIEAMEAEGVVSTPANNGDRKVLRAKAGG